MCNNTDGFVSILLNECLQMKLDLKEYKKYNSICIKFETSKEKPVEVKVMIGISLEGGYQLEGGIRESWLYFSFGC